MRNFFLITLCCLLLSPLAPAFAVDQENDEVPLVRREVTEYDLVKFYPVPPNDDFSNMHTIIAGERDLAYADLIAATFKGSFFSMTLLSVLPYAAPLKPERYFELPVPQDFWEKQMLRLYGEREGAFLIGAIAGHIATESRFVGDRKLMGSVAIKYLRMAANAGHGRAMYDITLLPDEFKDPQFTRPPTHTGTPVPVIAKGYCEACDKTPEDAYWLARSAAEGDPVGALYLGTSYLYPEDTTIQPDTEASLACFTKGLDSGQPIFATMLSAHYTELLYASGYQEHCDDMLYHYALRARLYDGGVISKSHAVGTAVTAGAEGMVAGNNEMFPKSCLTQEQADAILEKSKVEYDRIAVLVKKQQAEEDALYAAAKKRLPEVKLAYEQALAKQAKEKQILKKQALDQLNSVKQTFQKLWVR